MATDRQLRFTDMDVPVLRAIALRGWGSEDGTSASDLASHFHRDERRIDRKLDRLGERGFVDTNDGRIRLTASGQQFLWEEYRAYQAVFGHRDEILFRGQVTSGLGKGKQFVSLDGYRRQFAEKLGYEPFPGTLNVELATSSVRARVGLDGADSIRIEPWSEGDVTYGAAYCYPATVEATGGVVERAHLVVPVRTEHDDDEIEILAPVEIREDLDLSDGDSLTVVVEPSV